MSIHIKAPAKINLYLAVGNRLDNGLHRLTSVMQTVELADEIIITPAGSLIVECDADGLSGSANLVYKAAEKIREFSSVKAGVKIRVNKHIPIAAGLGGGSSDAAAALLALNDYWRLSLPVEILNEIAAKLGADVPFFLYQGTQLAHGYGQELSSLDGGNIRKLVFVLANPGQKLLAKDVYRYFDSRPSHSPMSIDDFLTALAHGDIKEIARNTYNDLEASVGELCPEVLEIKKIAVASGALAALVSGSGPTVVAIAGSRKVARKIADALTETAAFVSISTPLFNPAFR